MDLARVLSKLCQGTGAECGINGDGVSGHDLANHSTVHIGQSEVAARVAVGEAGGGGGGAGEELCLLHN